MAVGDIYQVNLRATQSASVHVFNTFHYRQIAPLPEGDSGTSDIDKKNSRALLNRFNEVVVDAVRAVQSTALVNDQLTCYSLYDVDDASSLAITKPGAIGVSEEQYPTFVAAKVALRVAARTRGGSKAIGGVPETSGNGNVIIASRLPAFVALATQLQSKLRAAYAGLGNDVNDAFEPVVVKRIKTAQGYRLPSSAAEAVAYAVVVAAVSAVLSTQNTRKR